MLKPAMFIMILVFVRHLIRRRGLDVYPNPSLTNDINDIILGNYGAANFLPGQAGSSLISPNPSWAIFPGRLGLGQAVFESSGWSGAFSRSLQVIHPWHRRGNSAYHLTQSNAPGVESINVWHGNIGHHVGFRAEAVVPAFLVPQKLKATQPARIKQAEKSQRGSYKILRHLLRDPTLPACFAATKYRMMG